MITTEDPRPLFVRFAPEKKALVRDAVADRMRALRRSVAVQKEEAREDQDYWTRPESVKVAKKPEALDQRRCVTCGYPMPAGSDECPICAPRLRSPAVGVARKAAVPQQPVSAPKPEPVVRAVSEQKEDVVVARRVDPSVEPSPKPKAVVPEPAVQKPEVPVEPAPRPEPSAPRPAPKPVAIPVSEAEKPAPRVDHVSRTPAQTSQPRVKTVSLTGMVVVKPKNLPGVKPRSGGGSG
jgi:hypothetical protein